MKKINTLFVSCVFLLISSFSFSQQKTYCNPINLDYGYCPIPDFVRHGKHRATADPVIVNYKGDFYLFSTNQSGYWWSHDLSDWHFIYHVFLTKESTDENPNLYDDLCAPAVWVQGDSMCVFGSTYTSKFPIWVSTNPKANTWSKAVNHFDIGGWDPDFFVDNDGKLYMYNGSSNVYPLYGIEINRKTFEPIGTRKEMLLTDEDRFGWQRFGEHMDDTFLKPFMEGSWMTKHNNKYYLQWGGPGTEASGYSDGYAVSNSPLGFFEHASLPLSRKAGGFIRGAGHGATFQDNWDNYWHISSMGICVKNNFERRLGLWPAGFDTADNMYCNTSFGDYPTYLPDGKEDHLKSRFTGWMLLNYKKPVMVSSTLGNYNANNIVNEDIKTYWSAKTADKGEWLQSDLGEVSTVNAVQINYADQDAEFMGKQLGTYHQYIVYSSIDGKKWTPLIDKSQNKTDVPHDYVQLSKPVKARYLKMVNIHMPTGKFAISGFRVFGKGAGVKPDAVQDFIVLRTEYDKRSAWVTWKPVDNAYAYNIYYGTEPDKLYGCIMLYDVNEWDCKVMDKTKPYYFAIEVINENGTSTWTRAEAK